MGDTGADPMHRPAQRLAGKGFTSDHVIGQRLTLFDRELSQAFYSLESLILAQDERWRRA